MRGRLPGRLLFTSEVDHDFWLVASSALATTLTVIHLDRGNGESPSQRCLALLNDCSESSARLGESKYWRHDRAVEEQGSHGAKERHRQVDMGLILSQPWSHE